MSLLLDKYLNELLSNDLRNEQKEMNILNETIKRDNKNKCFKSPQTFLNLLKPKLFNSQKKDDKYNLRKWNKNIIKMYRHQYGFYSIGFISFKSGNFGYQTSFSTKNCGGLCHWCLNNKTHFFCNDCDFKSKCNNNCKDLIEHLMIDHTQRFTLITNQLLDSTKYEPIKKRLHNDDVIPIMRDLCWQYQKQYLYVSDMNGIFKNSLCTKCTKCNCPIKRIQRKPTCMFSRLIFDLNRFQTIKQFRYICSKCNVNYDNKKHSRSLFNLCWSNDETICVYNNNIKTKLIVVGNGIYTDSLLNYIWFLNRKLLSINVIYASIVNNYIHYYCNLFWTLQDKNTYDENKLWFIEVLCRELLPKFQCIHDLCCLMMTKQTINFKIGYHWCIFNLLKITKLIYDQTFKICVTVYHNGLKLHFGMMTICTNFNLFLTWHVLNKASESHDNLLKVIPDLLYKILENVSLKDLKKPQFTITLTSDNIEGHKNVGLKSIKQIQQEKGDYIVNKMNEKLPLNLVKKRILSNQDIYHHFIRISKEKFDKKNVDVMYWFKSTCNILNSTYTVLDIVKPFLTPYDLDKILNIRNFEWKDVKKIFLLILPLNNNKLRGKEKLERKSKILNNNKYVIISRFIANGLSILDPCYWAYWLSQFMYPKEYMKYFFTKINNKKIKLPRTTLPTLPLRHIIEFICPHLLKDRTLSKVFLNESPSAYAYNLLYTWRFWTKSRYEIINNDDFIPIGKNPKSIKRLDLMINKKFKIKAVLNHKKSNFYNNDNDIIFDDTYGSIGNEQIHKILNKLCVTLGYCTFYLWTLLMNVNFCNIVLAHVFSFKMKDKLPSQFMKGMKTLKMNYIKPNWGKGIWFDKLTDVYEYKQYTNQLAAQISTKTPTHLNRTKYELKRQKIIDKVMVEQVWKIHNIIMLHDDINLYGKYVSMRELLNLMVTLPIKLDITEDQRQKLLNLKNDNNNNGNYDVKEVEIEVDTSDDESDYKTDDQHVQEFPTLEGLLKTFNDINDEVNQQTKDKHSNGNKIYKTNENNMIRINTENVTPQLKRKIKSKTVP